MERDTVYPVGEELAKIRDGFNHILDLKPGDKLRFKSSEIGQYKDRRADGRDGVFEVFRVLPKFTPGGSTGSNHECDESDFTVVSLEGAKRIISEYAFDSRRFERVTE